jgi:hypothetical protein
MSFSDVYKRGAPATTQRRERLLAWLRERDEHHGLTARQIVDVSGIYDSLQGRQEKCTNDLRVMAQVGLVKTNRIAGGHWWPR